MVECALIAVCPRLLELEGERIAGAHHVWAQNRALHLSHVVVDRVLVHPDDAGAGLHANPLRMKLDVAHLHGHLVALNANRAGFAVGVVRSLPTARDSDRGEQ